MARLRTRLRRTVLVVVALLVVLLLLELNRWLPGAWPGGGGGGFRAAGQAGREDPDAASTPLRPPARERGDPSRIEPPDDVPADWPPRLGIVIEVRGPDGGLAEGWRAGTGDGGAEDSAPDEGGRTLRRDPRLPQQGFRVRHGGRLVRHRHGTGVPATHWVVHLPEGRPPLQRRAGSVRLAVRDAASGTPLAGAQARWQAGGRARAAEADASGVLDVPAPAQGQPLAVEVSAEGHVPATTWVVPRGPPSQHVDLSTRHVVRARFRWPDGTPAAFTRVEARAEDGRVLARQVPSGMRTTGPQVELAVPFEALPGARLHLRPVRSGTEGLRLDLPLEGLSGESTLPPWRTVRLRVSDVQGRPLAGAQVVVLPDAGEGGGPAPSSWRTTTNLQGEALVSVPAGQDVGVLVARDRLGPAGRAIRALDGSDRIDVVLEEGLQVPVRVVDAQGQPVAGARLAARGVAGGVRVEQGGVAVTAADGRGTIGPLPAGALEIFASAPGFAWSRDVWDATDTMKEQTLVLERGRALRLVVAGPFGVPLAGVLVDVSVASGGAPLGAPPGHAAARTDEAGMVVLQDLPARRYDLTLSLPGWTTRILRGVAPGGATHFATLLREP